MAAAPVMLASDITWSWINASRHHANGGMSVRVGLRGAMERSKVHSTGVAHITNSQCLAEVTIQDLRVIPI
jgi:hypothetical protein